MERIKQAIEKAKQQSGVADESQRMVTPVPAALESGPVTSTPARVNFADINYQQMRVG